jgi:hypothetical protein
MALPARGTLGQIVDYNGYSYKWTGASWLNIGQSSLTIGNTTSADRIRLYDNKIEVWVSSVRRVVLGDLA